MKKHTNPVKSQMSGLLKWFARDNDGKASFAERYGSAFVILLIATVIVAFKAASADFEVLQAMMYNVQKSPKAAFAESLSLAVVLHALMFVAGSITFSNLIHGNVKTSMDDRIQTGFWAVIMVACLGVSLYLSINTDQYAKHQADALLQTAIANKAHAESSVRSDFNAEQQRIAEQFNADREAITSTYSAKVEAERAKWAAKIDRTNAKADDYIARFKGAGSPDHLTWMQGKARDLRATAATLAAKSAAAIASIEEEKAAKIAALVDAKNQRLNETQATGDNQYAAVAAAGSKSVEDIRADIAKAAAVLRYRNIAFSALGMVLLAIMHFMYRGITSPTLVQPKQSKAKKGNWLSRAIGQAKAAGNALLDKELPITMPAQAVATPRQTIGFKPNAVATPNAQQATSTPNTPESVATAKAAEIVQAKYLERARKSYMSDLRAWEAKGRSGAASAPKNIERLTAEINAIDAQLGKLK